MNPAPLQRAYREAMTTGPIDMATTSKPRRGRPSAAKSWLKAIEFTSRIEAHPHRLFADVVEERANKQPLHPALISDAESVSYRALAERINRYARWALSVRIEPGDTVSLIMPSRPDYVAAWLGISRIGGVVALINTNLVGQSLAHCINLAKAGHVILARGLLEAFESARPHLDRPVKIWMHDGNDEARVDAALASLHGGPLSSAERRDISINDRALLIYTSGTTGLPKAASISHRRILNWGGWFAGLADAAPDDRLYDCLPVYHSVGGIVAPCSMLSAGASVALADRFSSSRFWEDIVRFDCTLFQYIGELCRCLLLTPTHRCETQHRLRLCCGNGLRGDIWEAFRQRFHIPQILEFYAATEANVSLFNVEGRPGAIGRTPPFIAHRSALALVKFDVERNAPLRDENGFCVSCAANEAGEAIGRISGDAGARFDGYTDREATEKKILCDVLAPGDAWFRTGDLMRRDDGGFYY